MVLEKLHLKNERKGVGGSQRSREMVGEANALHTTGITSVIHLPRGNKIGSPIPQKEKKRKEERRKRGTKRKNERRKEGTERREGWVRERGNGREGERVKEGRKGKGMRNEERREKMKEEYMKEKTKL